MALARINAVWNRLYERYQERRLGISTGAVIRADANVSHALPKLRCKDVITVVGDAGDYSVPNDVTVVFFNNSFHGEIFGRFLGHLKASLHTRPRRMALIVSVPQGSDHIQKQVEDAAFLHKAESLEIPNRLCVFYHS